MSCTPRMFAALMAVLLASTSHAADPNRTYRWVDDKGRVHYSDVRSPKSEQVQVRPGSGVVGVAKQNEMAGETQRKENCERRKEQLNTYESATSISETDALGNVKTYSGEERQQFINRTRDQVNQTCGGPS